MEDPAASPVTTEAAVQETTPLIAKQTAKNGAKPVPMRLGNIWRGMETAQKAFAKDTLANYFMAADTFPFPLARLKLALVISWIAGIRRQCMLTIDDGTAFLKYTSPEKEDPWYVGLVSVIIGLFSSAETKKRRQEYGKLLGALAKETFGDRLSGMYKIIGLGTDPEVQGRGYGTALMRHVLEQSDAEGRDCCLVTTDAHRFYESLGFSVVRTGVVGADNPTWHGEPVIIRIMHRPAKVSTS
ncbi:hypothetical protein C8Q76DRAFT_793872 [Earliella scabrosa]|nr:hypothetical protein C8Q76DRAFT_793872 [Earliella scabrosa]